MKYKNSLHFVKKFSLVNIFSSLFNLIFFGIILWLGSDFIFNDLTFFNLTKMAFYFRPSDSYANNISIFSIVTLLLFFLSIIMNILILLRVVPLNKSIYKTKILISCIISFVSLVFVFLGILYFISIIVILICGLINYFSTYKYIKVGDDTEINEPTSSLELY